MGDHGAGAMLGASRVDGVSGSEPQAAQRSERLAFGSLLRQYRLSAGLTQERLAERAGISVRGIADLERGARQFLYADTIARLVGALELSPAQAAALKAVGRRPTGQSRQLSTEPTPPRRQHNLPAHLPTLIGRDEELATVRASVLELDAGLLTLTGPGGIGKTRLALAVAEGDR